MKQRNMKVNVCISVPTSILHTIEEEFEAKTRSGKFVDCLLLGISYYTGTDVKNIMPNHQIAEFKKDRVIQKEES